jgi:flagellar motor switch protein FliG
MKRRQFLTAGYCGLCPVRIQEALFIGRSLERVRRFQGIVDDIDNHFYERKIMTSHAALLNENDRTVAFVIAYTPFHNGWEIFAGLTPERQAEIVRQLAEFQPEDMPPWSEYCESGFDLASRLLESLDGTVCKMILDNISRNDSELADNIRKGIILFEDIARMSDPDVTSILQNVETSQLILALKGTSDELKEKIYKNMSKQAAKIFQEDFKYFGPQRASEVESAQRDIVDIMHRLADSGVITRPNPERFRWTEDIDCTES